MTWVETLAELKDAEGGKLFPTLFENCHKCNGTGIKPWNPSDGYGMAKPPDSLCMQFKCKRGLWLKPNSAMMGILVRIYAELFPDEWVVTFKDKTPKEAEEVLAETICMRAALVNYTGKVGSTT